MTTIALYPGTFDPMHNGHLDIARRSLEMFDRLIVGVYDLPSKKLLFGHLDRIALANEALATLPRGSRANAVGYSGLTAAFAQHVGAQVMIRGLRNGVDFDYELQLALTNQWLAKDVDTVCLFTGADSAFISSTIVREITLLGGDVKALVPAPVADALVRYRSVK